jgi:hypothetical protein
MSQIVRSVTVPMQIAGMRLGDMASNRSPSASALAEARLASFAIFSEQRLIELNVLVITPGARRFGGAEIGGARGGERTGPERPMVPREGIIRNHRHEEPLFVLSMVA